MAKFNPDIPDTSPAPASYLGATRPLNAWDIGVNKTGEVALSGAGNILGEAIRGVDDVIKTNIDQGVRQDLNTERDATTGAMEQILNIPQDQRVSLIQPDQTPAASPASDQSGAGTDIIPGATAAPLPSALQGVDQSVAGPASAIKAKPELSTYYLGKLDSIAKDWRSRYPGYSDYIDQRVASIVGGNPANERLKTMMTMIQQMQGNGAQEKEKALGFVGTNAKYPGAAQVAAAVSSGIQNPMAYAISWASKWQAIDKNVEDNLKQNQLDEGNNKVDVFRNQQTAVSTANSISNQMWNTTIQGLSIGPDGQVNPDKLNSFLSDIQTGQKKISEQDGQTYGQSILTFAQNVRRQIDDKLNASGAAAVLGPDKTKAIEDQAVSKYIDLGNMFLNKQNGPAGAAARAIIMDNDETGKWLLEGSPIKDAVGIYSAGAKMMGPAVSGILTFNLAGGRYGSLDNTVAEYAKRGSISMATTPNLPLSTVIDHADQSGVGKGSRPKSDNEVYNYFTSDLPAKIADPTMPDAARIQLAKNIFSGAVASKFSDDVIDPTGRNSIPGRHTVLMNMTTPNISESVWNLAGQNPNSDLWLQYKNWVTREASAIGTTDVKNFSQDAAINPNVNVQWDDKNNRLAIDFKDSFKSIINQPLISQYTSQVAKLNSTITPLVAIAKNEGQDPTKFVFQQLQNMGLDTSTLGPKEGLTPREKFAVAKTAFANAPSSEPTIQDYTQTTPKPADTSQIVGTANAAHPGPEWGNPIDPQFKSQHLTTIQTGDHEVQVNKMSAKPFQGFLNDLTSEGYNIKNVQGYSLREQRNGSGKISQHAFGNAIDINPDSNPQGGKTDLPKNVSQLAAKWGLTWGGDWSKKYRDPMHFEYTGRTPEQTDDEGYHITSK